MNINRIAKLLMLCLALVLLACPALAQDSVSFEAPTAADLEGEYGAAYAAAGNKVTFRYASEDPAIQKVEVFSQASMQFLKPMEVGNYIITAKTSAKTYSAYEYEAGMYPYAGGNVYYEMAKGDDGVYSVSLPLPAQPILYRFRLTYADGQQAEVEDPMNPYAANGDSNAGWSLVYIGDAEDAVLAMRNVFPREDEKKGSVSFLDYTAIDGTTQSIGVYLPYDYEAGKTYKTIYVSHGSGGNETEWMSIGGVPNIMDNLAAQGKIADTIVVTMDNSIFTVQGMPWIFGWDWEKMNDNILTCIAPIVEAQFGASKDAGDRAICGLSMGSIGASAILQQWPESFGYYGCFSAACNGIDVTTWNPEAMASKKIFVSAGVVDNALMNGNYDNPEKDNTSRNFTEHLTEAGIEHTFITFPGKHDWNVWMASFNMFVEEILW